VARYYETYNRLSRDPDADLLAVYDVAVDPQSEKAYVQLSAIRAAGQRQTGDIKAVVEAFIIGDSPTSYIADVCVDTAKADVIDADGNSVWSQSELRRTYATIWVERMGSTYAVSEIQAHIDQPC
jgi:hypothetical protein